MLKLEDIDHVACRASGFGNGTVELDLAVAGGYLMLAIDVTNNNDRLETGSVRVLSYKNDDGQEIACDPAAATKLAETVINENGHIMEDYERAVYDAQRDRARDGCGF